MENLSRRLRGLIARCHPSDRDDAMQEAALARLEGRSPERAVNRYRMEQNRRRKREICFTDMPPDPDAEAVGVWGEGTRDDT